MKKTLFILLLIVGAIAMMAHSASAGTAGGTKKTIPVLISPTTPPQPFTSAT